MYDSVPCRLYLLDLSDPFCLPVRAPQLSGHELQGSRDLAVMFPAVFLWPKILWGGRLVPSRYLLNEGRKGSL